MRIRTQFMVTMLLFGIVLAGISASAIIADYQVTKAGDQDRIAESIAQGASELSYLANDYVIYRESQQIDRWRTRFAAFSADVASLHASRRDQQALIGNIQANAQRLDDVFASVVAAVGRSSQDQGGNVTLPMVQISWSRMAVQSQGLVADASRLSQLLDDQRAQYQRTYSLVVMALIGVFVAFFLVNYLAIQTRILRSIANLRAGTAVIGSGDLDFRIEETRSDEIGDLSRAFNRMAANLKSANDGLLMERQRLYNVLETLPTMVCLLTPDYRVAFANRSFRNRFGESEGRHCYEHCYGQPVPCEFCESYRVLETGKPHHWEVRPQGSGEVIDAFDIPFTDMDGSPMILEVDIDITERKRAEAALQELNETLEERVATRTAELFESEGKLQAVFDAIADGVVVYNPAGVAVRANPAAVAMLGTDPVGRTRGELLSLVGLRHPDGRRISLGELPTSRAMLGARVVAEPLVYTRLDGEERIIRSSVTPLFEGDEVSGTVMVWHDITERQALEEALRSEARERAIFEERQRMARDLHDAVSQTLFSASLTADVLPKLYTRDPVRGQALLDELRRMNRGALAEMRALLAELRPQALIETDLAMLVRQLAEAAAGQSQVALDVGTEPVGALPGEVQVALYRIAQEALHNVAKHSKARQATVRLQSLPGSDGSGKRVVLSIEDDGIGFDPEALPANTFGLSIMRERAQEIRSALTLDSRPGGGTRIAVIWG